MSFNLTFDCNAANLWQKKKTLQIVIRNTMVFPKEALSALFSSFFICLNFLSFYLTFVDLTLQTISWSTLNHSIITRSDLIQSYLQTSMNDMTLFNSDHRIILSCTKSVRVLFERLKLQDVTKTVRSSLLRHLISFLFLWCSG